MSSTSDIRKSFLDFFVKNNHEIRPSSNLIPEGDDTLLFTNAGMVQFKNYFTGLETPSFKKAATVQKCLRAGGKHNDLDNVGYTARHHTFFEMLGNFSFGDYFKEEAIAYAWEYLNKVVGLPKDKLVVTVYHTDSEAYNLWKSIAGFSDDRIIRISTNDNFWEMGETGPCGPSTEIFYDHGESVWGGLPGSAEENGDRFIEIWNIVFMQYEKLKNGEMISLKRPSIDTGMGLERFASILQGKKDNYDIDLFQAIMGAAESEIGVKISLQNKAAFKVIADHIRSSSFMIAEGILPSNEGRGYILRRILRRAVRYAYMLGKADAVLYKIFTEVKNQMAPVYKELAIHDLFITDTIRQEETKFLESFDKGIKILNEEIAKLGTAKEFSGKAAFKLYDTYGFPIDLTKDVLREKKIKLDEKGFEEAASNHKNLAKKSWQGSGEIKEDIIWTELAGKLPAAEFVGYETLFAEAKIVSLVMMDENKKLTEVNAITQEGFIIADKTPFYAEMGGQVGDRGFIRGDGFLARVLDTQNRKGLYVHKVLLEEGSIKKGNAVLEVDALLRKQTARHHTATHLLHKALVNHLGNHITQHGSMVSENLLRFDITHPKALTAEEIARVEESVNTAILNNYPVVIEYMELEKAIALGAVAAFGEKYPKIARTIKIGDSKEENYDFALCGGTHVSAAGEIGVVKIISEGSIASGVRRIEAVAGFKALEYIADLESKIELAVKTLGAGADSEHLSEKILQVLEDNKKLKKSLESLNAKYYLNLLQDKFIEIKGVNCLFANLEVNAAELKNIGNILLNARANALIYLSAKAADKTSFMVAVSKDLEGKINLKEKSKEILNFMNATGGGSNLVMQGQGAHKDIKDIEDYFKLIIS
ncbi:MAG: alanine--tRNA ligase [Alphaproteobacteria bacterium]|nr:alanine--tRNA ligase [Alphaproteobacteria bacterium]